MRILWVINIPLPEASFLMKDKSTPFGGWLVNASKNLSNQNDLNLSIAFPKSGQCSVGKWEGKKNDFYSFPPVNSRNTASITDNEHLEEILYHSKPDIVHIFGTEYAHTLAMVNICRKKNIKTVISIQGLVSVIAKHYMAHLPPKIQNRVTLRDFLKRDNLKQQQMKFIERGKFEIESIQKVNHVIGRTTWDRACTTQINPDIQYHFCNETLREEFYKHTWHIDKCEKNSIFVSQGSYPIKGLHIMIEALPLILKKYPKTRLYIGGTNIIKYTTLKEKIKISSYGKYIKEIIKKNNLQNNVVFTGILDEKQMCERYMNSNVFVCPSSIENSPNSLGEAMILGVPSVASDVGGVADLLEHRDGGFVYQSDAPYMLAHYVNEIFSNKDLALTFSGNAINRALKTHNRKDNTLRMIDIYTSIIGKI